MTGAGGFFRFEYLSNLKGPDKSRALLLAPALSARNFQCSVPDCRVSDLQSEEILL
jgi:hypothetical protein